VRGLREVLIGVALLFTPALARAAPAPDWARPGAGPSRIAKVERETLGGAYERASDRLEWVNRGTEMRRVNVGLLGRRNATDNAAFQAERPSVPPPLIQHW
jgi:hypothetical protein